MVEDVSDITQLQTGDVIEGGTFMGNLDPSPIIWTVVTGYSFTTRRVVVEAEWLGIHLGRFEVTTKGTVRV